MILDWQQMNAGTPWGIGTFQARAIDSPSSKWDSVVPFTDAQQLVEMIKGNPASVAALMPAVAEFWDGKNSAANTAMKLLGDLTLTNVVSATRGLVGLQVQTVGLLGDLFRSMGKVYVDPEDVALKVLNVTKGIWESDAFQSGLDAIGMIPVVGWIVKAALDVAEIVIDIVRQVRDYKAADAYRRIASRLAVPIGSTQYTTGADTSYTRALFGVLQMGKDTYDPQKMIMPAYEGNNFTAEAVYESSDDVMGVGWVVDPGMPTGGIGLVPGTGNISHNLFFSAGLSGTPNSSSRGCAPGAPRDLGSLYPTAQGMANTWWSLIQRPGPGMFQVAPLRVKNDWANYIEGMLAFTRGIMSGWTCAPTGIAFSNKFDCIKEVYGMGSCKASKRGDQLTIPSDFGHNAHNSLAGYLYQLFFGLRSVGDRNDEWGCFEDVAGGGGEYCRGLPFVNGQQQSYQNHAGFDYPDPAAVDYDRSVPNRALDNLYARQEAVIQSVQCMYVDGYDTERFPAFKDNALKARWVENATALIQAGDWRRVSFMDMPEGELKNAVAQMADNSGINPNSLNPPCDPTIPRQQCPPPPLTSGPSVLGDPTPPPLPSPNDIDVNRLVIGGTGSGRKGGGAGIAIVAAAAVGLLLLKK